MTGSRRKTYWLLLAVAAVGLVIDRVVLAPDSTGPAGVSAATIPRTPVETAARQDKSGPASSASIPEIPFPTGLPVVDGNAELLDVFAPPNVRLREAWADGGTHNGRRGRGRAQQLGAVAFELRHTLVGVLANERLRMAVVDGRPVRIGESIDGCSLVEVSGYRAQFECRDGIAVLEVVGVAGSRDD